MDKANFLEQVAESFHVSLQMCNLNAHHQVNINITALGMKTALTVLSSISAWDHVDLNIAIIQQLGKEALVYTRERLCTIVEKGEQMIGT